MKLSRRLNALFAVILLGVVALVPQLAFADTDISDDNAVEGYITLRESDMTYNVTSDLSYPIRVYGDDVVINFNNHKLELSADSTDDAITGITPTYQGWPECTINDAVIINNGSGAGIVTGYLYMTANNCTVTTQDNYCVKALYNVLNIYGGAYTRTAGTGALAYVETYANRKYIDKCGLHIFSGSFTAPEGSQMFELHNNHNNSYVHITGGSFSYPDAATYVEGNAMVKGSDGRWIVTTISAADADSYYYVELSYVYDKGVVYSGRAYFGESGKAEADELAQRCGAEVKNVTRKVTFDADGGSPAPDAQDVGRGLTAAEPSTPHKAGYKFVAWLVKDSGEKFSFDTPITDAVDLVASYEEAADCKVSFDTTGGSFPSGSDHETTVQYDTAANCEPSEVPVQDGKVFDYWTLNGTDKFDFESSVTSDIVLKAVWKDAVAECDGTYYASLADALDATYGTTGKTVKLLKSTSERVEVKYATDLTIDLCGNTLGDTDFVYYCYAALNAISCDGLTVMNGKIEASYKSALQVYKCKNAVVKNIEACTTGKSSYYPCVSVAMCDSFTLDNVNASNSSSGSYANALDVYGSSGFVKGGCYESLANKAGMYIDQSTVTLSATTVTGGTDATDGSPAPAIEYYASSITIDDGTYADCLVEQTWDDEDDDEDEDSDEDEDDDEDEPETDSTISIEGGFFGSPDNASSVVAGKCLLKRTGGMYEVVSEDAAKSIAKAWVDLSDARVWYEDASEAKTYAEWLSGHEGSSLADTYNVASYVSRGETVMIGYVRKGGSLNYLPEGEEISGYTFAGWYVGESKKDTSFVPEGDVTLTAMWIADGGGEPVSDPDGASKRGGKGMPQTGDETSALGAALLACSGLVLAGFGMVRRRG